ncbi:MAG: NIPSNAP family protein [Bacteroidetes bacterium]|nr:NIPSNAP family protein [Fibrella sp.]
MNARLLLLLMLTMALKPALAQPTTITKPDSRLYEMRIYHPMPGKYAEIVDRFRQYTTKIFATHGMTNVGYWTPTDTSDHRLIYILAYPDLAARTAAWKAFGSDPAWKAVVAKTEANGKLVDHIDQIFMTESDISPILKADSQSPERTFEMRTYTATPGKLNNVVARFRDHTQALFSKHGMTHIGYFITTENDAKGQPLGQQPKLIYMLAHPSEAGGKQHFKEFAADPDWTKARDASEVNGKIVEKVESVYLRPTDYSTIK